jgi:predicted Zn-dependent protease with MMP-like domain
MLPEERAEFDRLLEEVLSSLPVRIQVLLEEVPLIVEDYPSPEIRAELGVKRRDELCGLYTGVPLNDPHGRRHRLSPDQILLFR